MRAIISSKRAKRLVKKTKTFRGGTLCTVELLSQHATFNNNPKKRCIIQETVNTGENNPLLWMSAFSHVGND